MSQKNEIPDTDKGPDEKNVLSKLNQLIASRFEDNCDTINPADISLRYDREEIFVPPLSKVSLSQLSAVDTKDGITSSDNNIIQKEEKTTLFSIEQIQEQEWKNKLNELVSSSFEGISYEFCEVELKKTNSSEKSDNSPKFSDSFPCTASSANLRFSEPRVQSDINKKANPILDEKNKINKSVIQEEKKTDILIQCKDQKESLLPNYSKQITTSGNVLKEKLKGADKKPVESDKVVNINDMLESVEYEMGINNFQTAENSKISEITNIQQLPKNSHTIQFNFKASLHPHAISVKEIHRKVAVLYSENHVKHSPKNTIVKDMERPERLTIAMDYLQRTGVFGERCVLISDKYPVSEKDLLLVHSKEYISFVKSYSAAGGGFLGDSTYMTPNTFEVAMDAAGLTIEAGELVVSGQYSAAMVMVRPPGHHAGVDKYRGFCIFNNVAILARYLQKKKGISKIMIIDWDAHAGDGTMEIFYNDPTVMVVSLHRDPHDFYPRRGFSSQTGEGAGKGYTANVEMPVGAGDEEYIFAFDEFVIPLLQSFSPDFVICSCGFDAYYREQLIKLNLTSAGYYMMTKKIMDFMNGNFVLVMEGGYHKFNGQLTHAVINSLLELPNPVADMLKTTEYERNQQKWIMKETQKKIAYVKEML